MNIALQNHLRWQSRRGMLELDIVLDKFWQVAGALSSSELNALAELLALDDGDLWRTIIAEERTGAAVRRRIVQQLHRL